MIAAIPPKHHQMRIFLISIVCVVTVSSQSENGSGYGSGTDYDYSDQYDSHMKVFCEGPIQYNAAGEDQHSIETSSTDPLAGLRGCLLPDLTGAWCLVRRESICNGSISCLNLTPCHLHCEDYYECQWPAHAQMDVNSCARRDTVCDGNPCNGCQEDHGWKNGPGFKCMRMGMECILPQQLLYDDIADCGGGIDLCFKSGPTGDTNRELDTLKCFQCLDGQMIIPASRVCDKVMDCDDLSDECLCQDGVPEICNRVILHGEERKQATRSIREIEEVQSYDNGETNADIDLDEDYFARFPVQPHLKPSPGSYLPSTNCDVGDIRCKSGKCIHRQNVCDGVRDCEEDESYGICEGTIPCMNTTQHEEVCRCHEVRWRDKDYCGNRYGAACDGVADCPVVPIAKHQVILENTFPQDECEAMCNGAASKFPCIYTVAHGGFVFSQERNCLMPENSTISISVGDDELCDGYVKCPFGDDEDKDLCEERGWFICQSTSFNRVRVNIPSEQVCDGALDCDDGSDEDEARCNETRYSCPSLGGAKVNIDRKFVCDFIINCDGAEDEKNCTDDDRFYCENGSPLFVRTRQTFDGRADCTDWSDECPMKNQSSITFYSRYELIGNPVLRGLVWIKALLSLVGNTAVIVHEARRLHQTRHTEAVVVANRLLVLNLAASDFVMGIYLLGLAIAGLTVSGRYCIQDIDWRSGSACTTLGVLAVVASEASVVNLMLLTGCRCFSVMKPFMSASYPKRSAVYLMMAVAWAAGLILAFVPLFPGLTATFASEARFHTNPFSSGMTTTLQQARDLLTKLLAYDLKPNATFPGFAFEFASGLSWKEIEEASEIYLKHSLKIKNHFGYYSASCVCVPKYFTSGSDPAWVFSLFMHLFNFTAFALVSAGYALIFHKTRHARSNPSLRIKGSAADKKQMRKMQRKICRLIITDFFCWMPICVMGFCNLAGATVENTAYAVSAILLLPINSALNPILYSDIPDIAYQRIKTRFAAYSSTRRTVSASTSTSKSGGQIETRL